MSMTAFDQQPDFDKSDGLIPVVVQESGSNVVLMLAYMNREAYEETLSTGQAVYYSRSRGGLWRKGQSSGHVQHVKQVLIDCDRDTILLTVEQVGGAACHNGFKSCFYRRVTDDGLKEVAERVFDPHQVYDNDNK